MATRWTADSWDVVLTKVPAEGGALMPVVRLLRETMGFGNAEARHFIENLPQTMKEDLSEREAQSLRNAFDKSGAAVEVRPSRGTRKAAERR